MGLIETACERLSHYDYLILGATFLLGVLTATLFRILFFRKRKKEFKHRSRSVIKGLVTEQFAPLFPDFKYNLSDVRFLGNPVDLVVFNGLHKNAVQEIIFLEIKSSRRSPLTKSEKSVREAVRNKEVRWEIYRLEE